MILRKSVTMLALAAALLSASINQSKAGPLAVVPTPVATGAALSMGTALTIGFIGVVAAICVYDIWLKFNGYKNWDGTPKVVVVHHHRHYIRSDFLFSSDLLRS